MTKRARSSPRRGTATNCLAAVCPATSLVTETVKFIEFIEIIVDITINAYIIWKRYQVENDGTTPTRESFLIRLTEGFIEIKKEVHTPDQAKIRKCSRT